jgi:hypothetical protein
VSKITVRHTDGSVCVLDGHEVGYFDNEGVLEARTKDGKSVGWFHNDHWISVIVEQENVFSVATNAIAGGS